MAVVGIAYNNRKLGYANFVLAQPMPTAKLTYANIF
jgi:hypothetical protein